MFSEQKNKKGENMYILVFMLIFLGLTGLFVLSVYALGAAIKRRAQKPIKSWFAPVPRPGTSSFVAREGLVVDVFENVVGWHLEKTRRGYLCFFPGSNTPSFLEKQLGVKWLGPYGTIKNFEDFEWSELQEKEIEENGKKVVRYEIITRKGNLTDFFFQFSHPIRTEAIEIRGNIQVSLTMLVTVLNLYPERAQFLNKDPAILLAGMIQSVVKSFICDMDINQIKRLSGTAAGQGQAQNQELWDNLKNLNGLQITADGTPNYESEDPLGVFGKLGKYIVRAEIVQVEALGKGAEAIEAKELAILRGDAKIAEAEKQGEANIVAAEKAAQALIVAAQGRMDAAERDAAGQMTLNEANAGYFASLPGGQRMFVADRISSEQSDVAVWAESGADANTVLPLALPPKKPKPERIKPISEKDKS